MAARAAAAPEATLQERLSAAAADAKPAGASNGQNYVLVKLLALRLSEIDESFTDDVRTSLKTRVGASAMIQVLKDDLGVEDLKDI